MSSTPSLYIGLMSGTSLDGADAALVDCAQPNLPVLRAAKVEPPPGDLRDALLDLAHEPTNISLNTLGALDVRAGHWFADAACSLMETAGVGVADIQAIGSHGQTVAHQPNAAHAFSLQLGAPSVIAARTGCPVIADFRNSDIAVGGQGAPLACAFHAATLAHPDRHRAVVNIGGIANVTILPAARAEATEPPIGFDTGPGNALMDAWINAHRDERCDQNGAWAGAGNIDRGLLDEFLREPYLQAPPPKSTGRDYFDMRWLQARIDNVGQAPEPRDVQATLAEFTAHSIGHAIASHAPATEEILVCGGGTHNRHLRNRLEACLAPANVRSTNEYGIDVDWLEAMAFAWLAHQTINARPGNLAAVTGARCPAILGGLYRPPIWTR